MPGDDFTQALLKLMMARAMEGESQIQETKEWSRETMAWGPLYQALTAVAGLFAVFLGLGCIGAIGAWVLAEDWATGDMLFGAALFACLGLIALLGIMALIHMVTKTTNGSLLAVLACSLLAMVLTAGLLLVGRARGTFAWWQFVLVVVGFALLLPGLTLTYRQLMDLLDPFGKISPMERFMQPYLAQVFSAGQAQEPVTVIRPFPVHVNGSLTAANMDAEQSAEMEPPETEPRLDPKFVDMIELVKLAQRRGLARDGLVVQPRLFMPSGLRLTRPYFDALMLELDERWHIIRRNGSGMPAEWVIEPDAALDLLGAVLDTWQPGWQPGRRAA